MLAVKARALAAAIWMVVAGYGTAAQARVIELRLGEPRPFADGAVIGAAGAYERITGVARGELDPADSRNAGIVDLQRAPRNARGRVDYEVDVDLLRPANGGNRKLLYDVTNRGRKFLTHWMMDGPPATANDPMGIADVGNALYLRQGWTIVWAGWDPDAPRAGKGMSMKPVVATDNGQPIRRMIRDEFQSGTRAAPVREFRLSYEAAGDRSQMRLTVRRHEADPRVPLPDEQWRLKDPRTIEILTSSGSGVGPVAGSIYELHYPATNPLVLGIGFAATRDLISFLRHERTDEAGTPNPAGTGIKRALAVGISQSGRFLRDFISQGFNQDEQRRRVFDGVLAHISGVGRVFLNTPFGQPFRTNTQHEDHLFPENEFPFSAAVSDDPVSGRAGALLRGDGFDPLLIETNTSTEYWQKGASLLHTRPDASRDLALPAGARVYLIAGTQHGGRIGLTTARGPCQNERNPHNPAPALRALLAALDDWVDKGIAPPPSRVPLLADATLVEPDNAGFPVIPGFGINRRANAIVPISDWTLPRHDASRRYPVRVPRTDADGNENVGIRLPDIAVPLATYTGWNLYKAPFPDSELCDRDGSYAPFARTRAERERNGDPRLSIEERYADANVYLRRVTVVVTDLVGQRLLLQEDATRYLDRANQTAARMRVAP